MQKKLDAAPAQEVVGGVNVESIMLDVVSELQDQERRKSNIILSGVPEPKDAEPDARKAADMLHIKEIANLVCPGMDLRVITAFRLGQSNPSGTKPRLLKVVLESTVDQQKLVAAARELRKLDDGHLYFKVFLNPDRTPTQRTLDKARRERARERRAAHDASVPHAAGFQGGRHGPRRR
jgi:hypothetical protein